MVDSGDEMKASADKENPDGVRRFRYNAPKKKESLAEQWSLEFGAKSQPSKLTFSSSFGLDDAWSIRKNVAVGPNKAKNSVAYSNTSVYSRHKTISTSKDERDMTSQKQGGSAGGQASYSSKGSLIPQINVHSRPQVSNLNTQCRNSFETMGTNQSFGKDPFSHRFPEQKPAPRRDFDQSSSDSPFDF